jgi:hypothetical protein
MTHRFCGSFQIAHMEQADIFSARIRWLAIATGVASALALFPILDLLYPALLIAGGYIQPRFPITGKWLVWAGAANLWPVVMVYDVMMFQDLWGKTKSPELMVLTFPVATVALMWCSVELVRDGVKRVHARRSIPPTEPHPVSLGAWILGVVLNLLLGWSTLGWVLAPSGYRSPGNFYSALAMSLVLALTIVAFDISLIWRVAMARRLRRIRNA